MNQNMCYIKKGVNYDEVGDSREEQSDVNMVVGF